MDIYKDQIKKLREYAEGKKGELADICNEAANSIEYLATDGSPELNKTDRTYGWDDYKFIRETLSLFIEHGYTKSMIETVLDQM